MHVYTDTEGTIKGLGALVRQALEEGRAKSLLILSCDGNALTPDDLDPLLRDIPVPVLGGLFPVILSGTRQLTRGSVVVALDQSAEVNFVPGLSLPQTDFEAVLDELVSDDEGIKTVMVFIDGLSGRIGDFIEALYAIFGLEVNYIGGGAGSLTFEQGPCILTNDGLKQDGAVVASFPMESSVGVSHGWRKVSGPYKVTESSTNCIKSLNWQPAFDVYRDAVEEHSGRRFMALPFFDIAKAYPFGIARMGTERVVRDPISLDEDNGLICVGEVPEGSYVDILHGDSADMVQAASRALDLAQNGFPESAGKGLGLIMDCVSRVLFLQDDFSDELAALVQPDVPFVGACSIGEIANSGKDYLEFYNKTAVVAFLEGK